MKTLTPRDLVKIAFPEYKGRKIRVTDGARTYVGNTCWDGGTKSDYVAINLATGQTCGMPRSASTPREMGGTAPDDYMVVPAGFALVEHAFFCGRDTGCTVTFGAPPALATGETRRTLDAGV